MSSRKETLPEGELGEAGSNDNDGSKNFAKLIELGRKKTYVTIDDILNFSPEAERDVDTLEEAFTALLEAKIPYVDDDTAIEPTDKNLLEEDDDEDGDEGLDLEESYLLNVDTDDMIGLYLKEVGRVPLLTAPEEVSLAKRIEKGRKSREKMAKPNFNDLSDDKKSDYRINVEDGWAARDHLIQANSRLVVSVAKKYLGRGVPF